MAQGLGAVCDEFFVSSRLFLKLEMTLERDTVLHFFDRLRKEYPSLKKLRRRDPATLVLEEEPEDEQDRGGNHDDPDGGARTLLRVAKDAIPQLDTGLHPMDAGGDRDGGGDHRAACHGSACASP